MLSSAKRMRNFSTCLFGSERIGTDAAKGDRRESSSGAVLHIALTRQSKRRDCFTGFDRYASISGIFNAAATNDRLREVKMISRVPAMAGSVLILRARAKLSISDILISKRATAYGLPSVAAARNIVKASAPLVAIVGRIFQASICWLRIWRLVAL